MENMLEKCIMENVLVDVIYTRTKNLYLE